VIAANIMGNMVGDNLMADWTVLSNPDSVSIDRIAFLSRTIVAAARARICPS
jgi:hypothetical protein